MNDVLTARTVKTHWKFYRRAVDEPRLSLREYGRRVKRDANGVSPHFLFPWEVRIIQWANRKGIK